MRARRQALRITGRAAPDQRHIACRSVVPNPAGRRNCLAIAENLAVIEEAEFGGVANAGAFFAANRSRGQAAGSNNSPPRRARPIGQSSSAAGTPGSVDRRAAK
jgi:hypothetical protein